MKSAGVESRDGLAQTTTYRLARAAGSVIGTARGLALWSGASGIAAWAVLFSWIGPGGDAWSIVLWATAFIVFVLPATVLTLFWLGLRAVSRLPGRMVDAVADASDQGLEWARGLPTRGEAGGRLRRLLAVVRGMVAARAALFEGRDLLLGGVALARLFNPLSLVTVVLSLAASGVLFGFAVIAGLASL